MIAVVIVAVVVLVYALGRSDGKDTVRNEIEKALTGKRKGRK